MKFFKFLAVALVAMLGFSSCSEDCEHDFIEVDHSKDIVGTWTCLEEGFAQAFVFNADGTATTTGVENGEYWEDVQVNWTVKNNKLILSYKDNVTETLLELIPGKLLSIKGDKRRDYQYCANDLSDELVGMWVCNDGLSGEEKDMGVITYSEEGKAIFTGDFVTENNYNFVNIESTYKVVGNILFQKISFPATPGVYSYLTYKLTYAPNGTSLGDIMTQTAYLSNAEGVHESTSTWLRIKQDLDLSGKKYDHIKTYVSNVKGQDKDINFMGYTFNFAKMNGSGLDKMLKSLLFAVEFPNENTLSYSYQMNGKKEVFDAPIVVEGNKMTIKMSAKVPTLKDVVFYTFQDADCSQMHFYMHKTAFVNFYTNMQAMLLAGTNDQFDITNAEAVNAIYESINSAVETINVSLVMTKSK